MPSSLPPSPQNGAQNTGTTAKARWTGRLDLSSLRPRISPLQKSPATEPPAQEPPPGELPAQESPAKKSRSILRHGLGLLGLSVLIETMPEARKHLPLKVSRAVRNHRNHNVWAVSLLDRYRGDLENVAAEGRLKGLDDPELDRVITAARFVVAMQKLTALIVMWSVKATGKQHLHHRRVITRWEFDTVVAKELCVEPRISEVQAATLQVQLDRFYRAIASSQMRSPQDFQCGNQHCAEAKIHSRLAGWSDKWIEAWIEQPMGAPRCLASGHISWCLTHGNAVCHLGGSDGPPETCGDGCEYFNGRTCEWASLQGVSDAAWDAYMATKGPVDSRTLGALETTLKTCSPNL